MNGDPGNREMVLGYLDPVLKRDLARASGMLGGKLPASCVELDERQLPERGGAYRLLAPPAQRSVSRRSAPPRGAPLSARLRARPYRLSLSLFVADGRAKIRKHRECTHAKRVVVEALCELERFRGAPVCLDRP